MKAIMWLVHFIEVLVIETEIKCGYICNGKESVKPKLASPLYSFMMRFFYVFPTVRRNIKVLFLHTFYDANMLDMCYCLSAYLL